MTMQSLNRLEQVDTPPDLNVLPSVMINQIEQLLMNMQDFGEIRLLIEKGRIKYIQRVESYKALNSPVNSEHIGLR